MAQPVPGAAVTPQPTVGLVPLDDRPCNRLFPQQLAAISGWRVDLPPRELLGWFTRPGECDAIADWLLSCQAERLIVSLDMLCFGGLVTSRRAGAGLEEAMRRLEVLREVRRHRPAVRLFAFSNLMRLGTTVTSPEDLARHSLLLRYSQLVDRVERLGEEAARPELEQVVAELGPDALSQYLAVRRRNHAVNRAAIQLVAEGVVDYLVLPQEDAAPVGLHLAEQLALRDQAAEYRVADRVAIHPGADEVGLVLLARHHLEAAGELLAVAIEYGSAQGAQVIPGFEHQPLCETVESQLRAAGARPAPREEAEAVLAVHSPIRRQRDISEAPAAGDAGLAAQARDLVARTRAAHAEGRLVALADVAYSNGADPELVAALAEGGGCDHLAGFAGWNTAANTLGTVIAQLALAAVAADRGRAEASDACRRFLACRLLDDYGYQTRVRPLAAGLAAELGANPFALGEAWPSVERYVVEQLTPLAHDLYLRLLGAAEAAWADEVMVSLPWGRLFEVEVELAASSS